MKKEPSQSTRTNSIGFYEPSKILLRERVVQKFESRLKETVTLVTAPAGYGKSVSVQQWINQKKANIVDVHSLDSFYVRFQPSSTPTIYIFDHCEEIHCNQLYERTMKKMIELPSHSHAVFISREVPTFSLTSLRLNGKLKEIRARDLMFTDEEIKKFFVDFYKVQLDSMGLSFIKTYTNGWAAGVSHFVRNAQEYSNIQSSIEMSAVFNFFDLKIFHNISSNMQHFMLKTSVVETMTTELCNKLTGMKNGQSFLKEAAKANLFVFQDLCLRNSWRYHPLFALFLQSECRRRYGMKAYYAFHLKASEWFNMNGNHDLAIDHALASKSYDLAQDLIVQHSTEHLRKGHYKVVQNWLDSIPELSSELLNIQGWVKAFTEEYQEAIHCFEKTDDRENSNFAEKTIGKGYIAICRCLPDQALERFKEATERWNEVSRIFRKGADLNFGEVEILKGRIGLGGRLHDAWHLYSQIETLWKHKDLAVFAYGSAVKAEWLYEKNELDQVINFIMKGLELGHRYNHSSVLVSIHMVYMKLKRATGRIKEMWFIFDNIKKYVSQLTDLTDWLPVIKAFEIRMLLFEKHPDPVEINNWLNDYSENDFEEVDFKKEFETMTVVRCFMHQRKYSRAHNVLTLWEEAAVKVGRVGSQIEIGLLKALVAYKSGNFNSACKVLKKTLILGHQEGYIRSFLDHGYPLSQLLAAALQRSHDWKSNGVIESYGKLLLLSFEQEIGIRNWSKNNRTLTEPLTDRELEILNCIVKGFSNTVIAGRFGIKIGTVKTHLVNLYGKLNVENRAQASAKAQELGLVNL